jgi:hypothetical protein
MNMSPDRRDRQENGTEELPASATHSADFESEQDTQARIPAEREVSSETPEEPEAPEKKGIMEWLRGRYQRARDGRHAGAVTPTRDRSVKSKDRSKILLALGLSVILALLVLVGMFSQSTKNKPAERRRTTPSLGRPEVAANAAVSGAGSVTPLQSVDMTGQEGNGDQVGPDDVNNTARKRLRPESKAASTLASVPPMSDPALEAYRQAKSWNAPPPSDPPTPARLSAAPVEPPRNEADGLKKSSLVFVRNSAAGSTTATRMASQSEPALLARRRTPLLPGGTRLVARMQSAASTAVKAPVVAAIEYNYERDGDIIIPAGAKAFGDLQQANRNGVVSVRFHTLQMPDGMTEAIDGTAMSLTYGPLNGNVTGSNRGKRILVRSLTGVGTIAAYLVGGRGGFSGASGQLSNSVLLRERVASNAGLAGEQELMNLAMNEQIVVTVPANTRFFIVLQDASSGQPPSKLMLAGAQGPEQSAVAGNSLFPTPEELRQLIELKNELNRMYREVAATSTAQPVGASAERQQP